MSGAEDIPEDVWAAANRLVAAELSGSSSAHKSAFGLTSIVARAILAERERCATVAENLMGEQHLVRLTLRGGQHLNLAFEEGFESLRGIEIDTKPAGDDDIIVSVTVIRRGEAGHSQRNIDDAVQGAASQHDVGEGNRNVVGVGNEPGVFLRSTHQVSLNLKELNSRMADAMESTFPM